MNFVEPIRDIKKIAQIKNTLRWAWKIRELLLFELWINSALRISDLLWLQISHIFDEQWNIKEYFDIKEKKTGKTNRISITPKVKETLRLYKETYTQICSKQENYIFFHTKKKTDIWSTHIGRKQAWQMIWKRCSDAGLVWAYGTHTLRKTRGYHANKKWVSLAIIQQKFQHSSLVVTMRYIWITHDDIMKACNDLDL